MNQDLYENPFMYLGLPGLCGALALVALYFGLRAGRRQWLVRGLPTSKTTGVFIGLVEVKGTAETEHPLTSFLAESACVYYAWQVTESWSREVSETSTDKDGRKQTRTHTQSGSTTVAAGGEAPPFYLRDDYGVLLVRPDGAQLEPLTLLDESCDTSDPLYYEKGPADAVPDSDFRRRFTEYGIPLHEPLYVVGPARERADVVAAEIAAEGAPPLFLISTRSEEEVETGYRRGFWLPAWLGLGLAVGGLIARDQIFKIAFERGLPLYCVAGGVYLLAWGLGWLGLTWNSLVELRQRARQGQANVDVQLQRRHDLIPALVDIVTGLRDYERAAQAELAALRAQLHATPPGEPGADWAGCLPTVRALAEKYPYLRANTLFVNLQRQLKDTEERVALARAYFNEIATFYNTCLAVAPDSIVAALGDLRPQALLDAAGFERAPVGVRLAE